LSKYPTINGSKEHIDDLNSLAHVPLGLEELFNKLEELFITKWESKKMLRADAFIAYYKSQWKGKKWSRAFLPEATSQTNNGAESHNKHYKERFLKSRPSLFDTCVNMFSDVEQISSDFANKGLRGKSEYYLVTHNHWKQAKIYQKELNESNHFFPFHENDDTEAPPVYVLYPSTKHIKDVTEEHEQKEYKLIGTKDPEIPAEVRKILQSDAEDHLKEWKRVMNGELPSFVSSLEDWQSFRMRFEVISLIDESERKTDIPYKCYCTRKTNNTLDGYQNTGVCKHVLHGSVCYAGVDIPDELKDQIRSNAKRGAKSKRTKALENQTGKQPSPCKPKARKKKKNVASTKNIASSEKVSGVESEAQDDGTL